MKHQIIGAVWGCFYPQRSRAANFCSFLQRTSSLVPRSRKRI